MADFGADPATHERSQSLLSPPSGECPGEKLKGLAARCEDAPETHQVMLLWQAWDAVNGKAEPVAIDRWPGWRMPMAWEDFKTKINAHAYLDAAISLVPQGYEWSLEWEQSSGNSEWVARCKMGDPALHWDVEAATLALAMCAAALRALARIEARQGGDVQQAPREAREPEKLQNQSSSGSQEGC